MMQRGAHRLRRAASSLSMEDRAKASKTVMLEQRYGANNYHPLPVVIARGSGVHLYDEDGVQYLDFLSAYSAVNQGHCHPRIVSALTEQAQKLTLTSRAFYNDQLGPFCEKLCTTFDYERALPMNTGVEAGETATKLCRRWAYDVKGVPDGQATMLFARGNFWGRTIAAISTSTDETAYARFGPLAPGFELVDYDDLDSLEAKLKSDPTVAAFFVEPIQGEAGVVVPRTPQYLKRAKELCHEYGALLVADEVQTGLGRTGKMLCSEWDDCKPDLVVLGKALSGGVFPVSAVLTSDEVMLTLKPGEHGSTYGGNPLACAVASAALDVLVEERLSERAQVMGVLLRDLLQPLVDDPASPVEEIRGRGLMNAIVVRPVGDKTAWDLCILLARAGLLAKPTHDHIIRLAPPLVITEDQLRHAAEIIKDCVAAFAAH